MTKCNGRYADGKEREHREHIYIKDINNHIIYISGMPEICNKE
jgi:hypothetical protein